MLLTLFQTLTHASPHAASQVAGRTHAPTTGRRIVRYFFKLGLLGLFLISAIDSSPIPLPIPGSSDLLVVLLAAQRHGWFLVTLIARRWGSIAGAAASYQTGVAGGLPLVNKYVPARFRDRITRWTENHSLLSVALPAILPPPAPLMPFLIAAGALKMPPRSVLLELHYQSLCAARILCLAGHALRTQDHAIVPARRRQVRLGAAGRRVGFRWRSALYMQS